MSRRRFSARYSSARAGGFTLAEVLVGLTIASLVILGIGTGYVFTTKAWVEHQARAQAQQSLRAAVGAISRELRISGACMGITWVDQNQPLATNFRMLGGTYGPPDSVTSTNNPRCAGPTPADCPAACTTITVGTTLNFVAGMWAFVSSGDPSATGQYFLVQAVDTSAKTLTVAPSTPVTGPYSSAGDDTKAFVAGADQRTFAVSSSCPECNGISSLTLTQLADGGTGHALVKGIDTLTVRYVLNRRWSDNPALCNAQTGGTNSLCVVNRPGLAPSLAGDWPLVRALIFTIGARSTIKVRGSGDGYYHLSESVEFSPRNFIFSPNGPRVPWTPY
jgi:type II secretory pathway pseudopilin PulG